MLEFFSDMAFVLKIFVLLAIIGFLNQHIENKTVKTIVFLLMGYFILIKQWSLFGSIWLIYTILGIGVSGMLVDLFFVSAQSGQEDMMKNMQEGENKKEAIEQDFTPSPAAPGSQGKNPMMKPPMMRR